MSALKPACGAVVTETVTAEPDSATNAHALTEPWLAPLAMSKVMPVAADTSAFVTRLHASVMVVLPSVADGLVAAAMAELAFEQPAIAVGKAMAAGRRHAAVRSFLVVSTGVMLVALPRSPGSNGDERLEPCDTPGLARLVCRFPLSAWAA